MTEHKITTDDCIEWLEHAAEPNDDYLPNYFSMITAIRDKLIAAKMMKEALAMTDGVLSGEYEKNVARVKALIAWEATE